MPGNAKISAAGQISATIRLMQKYPFSLKLVREEVMRKMSGRTFFSTRSAFSFFCTFPAFTTLTIALLSPSAHAETDTSSPGWTGTAGIGPIAFPKYVGGRQSRIWPIPILSINYNDTFYVELERIGVYLLASDDKKTGLGLAAEPRFGYSSKDGALLKGMNTRRDSVEGGPTFDWDFDIFAISLAWFRDLDHASRGQSQRATLYAPTLKNDRWDTGILLAADRMNGAVADYYFGVTAAEATAARRFYRAPAGTHVSLGFSGTFRLDKRNALMFGVNSARLGGSAARSPLAETRYASTFYLGYGWSL